MVSFLCVCVYQHVFVCTCMCVWIGMFVCVCVCTCVCVDQHMCLCVCVCMGVHMSTCACRNAASNLELGANAGRLLLLVQVEQGLGDAVV